MKILSIFFSFLIFTSCGIQKTEQSNTKARAVDDDAKNSLIKVTDGDVVYPVILTGFRNELNPASNLSKRGYRLRCDRSEGLHDLLKVFGYDLSQYLALDTYREEDGLVLNAQVSQNPVLNCLSTNESTLLKLKLANGTYQYYLDFGKKISGKNIYHMAGCQELITALGHDPRNAQEITPFTIAFFANNSDEYDLNCNVRNRLQWQNDSLLVRYFEKTIPVEIGANIAPIQSKALVRQNPNLLVQYRMQSNSCGSELKLDAQTGLLTGKIDSNIAAGKCEIVIQAYTPNLESPTLKIEAKYIFDLGQYRGQIEWQTEHGWERQFEKRIKTEAGEAFAPISLQASVRNLPNLLIHYRMTKNNCGSDIKINAATGVITGKTDTVASTASCEVLVQAFAVNLEAEIRIASGNIIFEFKSYTDYIEWQSPQGLTPDLLVNVNVKAGERMNPYQLIAKTKINPSLNVYYKLIENTCGESVALNTNTGVISGIVYDQFSQSFCTLTITVQATNLESQVRAAQAKVVLQVLKDAERLQWGKIENLSQVRYPGDSIAPIKLSAKAKNNPNLIVSYTLDTSACNWLRLRLPDEVLGSVTESYNQETFAPETCRVGVKAYVLGRDEIAPIFTQIEIVKKAFSSASDFGFANQLYRERESRTKALQARALYLRLGQIAIKDDEKAYAYTQVYRLDYLRATVWNASEEEQLKIYENCYNMMDALNPAVGDMTAEAYFSGKMMCLALWMEKAGTIKFIELAGKFKELKGAAEGDWNKFGMYSTNANGEITLMSSYDGGSFARYMALVMGAYFRPMSTATLGIHDPKNAVSVALQATKLPARNDRALPIALEGKEFFENTYVYAIVLREIGQFDLGKQIAFQANEEIAVMIDNDILADYSRVPETLWIKSKLEEFIRQ